MRLRRLRLLVRVTAIAPELHPLIAGKATRGQEQRWVGIPLLRADGVRHGGACRRLVRVRGLELLGVASIEVYELAGRVDSQFLAESHYEYSQGVLAQLEPLGDLGSVRAVCQKAQDLHFSA